MTAPGEPAADARAADDPPPPRRDLVEVIHGIEVADPFRELEDDDSPRTRAWVDAQNRRTASVLGARPGRDRLRARLEGLLGVGSSLAAAVGGDRVVTLERWPGQDQAVLAVRATDRPEPARTLVDPVPDPAGGEGDPTAAIDWHHPSPDGRLVAYGRSTGGDERSTLHVVEVATGRHLPDRIPRTRACSLAWAPDGSGFAYTRYPDPTDVPAGEAEYRRTVHWHQLGAGSPDGADDEVVWDDLPDPTAFASVDLSPDGRWLLVHLSLGWSRVDVHLVDRSTGDRAVVIEGTEAVSTFTVVDDRLVGHTTLDADRGRVVTAPLFSPGVAHWTTLIPEQDAVIEALAVTADSLLVLRADDGVSRLDRHDHAGGDGRPVTLPEVGSVVGLDGSRQRDEAFVSFTSFTRPPTLYRWTPAGAEVWSGPDAGGAPGQPAPAPAGAPAAGGSSSIGHAPGGGYVVERHRYPSADGTDIPLLVVRAAATVPGPGTPCVLTAYGGFGLTVSPAYSAAVVAVCDDGGIWAVPGIRGGGERGESWHDAGKLDRKQTSFDDFLAAADWLVSRGWTSRERLAIRGGSNGGLLMGAALTQRPDLCRAAHVAVPLADMVRFPRFLIARLWVPEYGDPDRPEDLAWLHAYSPYHRVADGTCYPAVLVTTAAGDSRVHPLHARKLAARLQEATSCARTRPILLREETRAGHGQGKPVSRQADELADVLAFLHWQLDWSPAEHVP